MFDGKVRGNRAVSSAGKKRESDKEAFLENTRKQREERATERKKLLAVVKLQSVIRQHHERKVVVSKFMAEMDKKVADVNSVQKAFKSRGSHFNLPLDVLLPIFRAFLFTFNGEGVYLATKVDVEKLIRIASILQSFLNSVSVTVIGSFNPFLQAVCEMGASDDLRIWGHQVSELCRLSVCLLRSYFLLEESDANDVFAANKALLTTAVECSTQVLHTVLYWQRDIAPIIAPQSVKLSSKGSSGTVTVSSESILRSDPVLKGESDVSSGEMFLCSLCRYIADSCSSAIRMSILMSKSAEEDVLISRAVTLLLAVIQKAILPLNIPKARFKFCETRYNALGCVARDILTIPLLKSRHNVLSPLLQSLSREDGAGLLLALRGMSDSTVTCQGGDHLQDKFLQKVHFLNNYCTCALSVTPDGHVFQDGLRMLVTSSSSSSEIPGSSSSSIPSPDASSTSSSSSSSSLGGAGPLDSGKKRGGSWIESVCDTLFALPLVMILNRMPGVLVPDHGIVSVEGKASDEGQSDAMQVVNEEIDDSDPLPGTEDLRVADQAFALAGGVKRLEYRLSAVLGVIRSRESIAFRALRSRAGVEKRQNTATASAKSSASSIAATAHVSSDSKKPRASYTTDRYAEMKRKGEPVHLNSALLAMDTIVRVLTANNAVSILTDAITSTCNSENILSLFAVVKVYSKILMSCPSGLEAAHTEALPLSISILNAMAFSRPKDPLTRRLWSLINSFDATVLTEAFSKAPTTASAATAASSAIASSATYATTQIGFNVTRTSSSSSSSVGAGGGAGGGTSSVPLLYLSSTMQAAARHGITPSELCEGLQSCLYLLCCVLSHQLTATDDEEFFGLVQGAGAAVGPSTGSGSGPMSEAGTSFKTLPLKDIILLIPVLKNILYKLYWNHPFPENAEHSAASSDSATMLCDLQMRISVTRLFNQLYTRNERRSYLSESSWHLKGIPRLDAAAVSAVMTTMDQAEGGGRMDDLYQDSRTETLQHVRTLLSCIPQVIPFDQRVDVFQSLLQIDKANFFSSDGGRGAMAAVGFGGSVQVKVHRDSIVEDAFLGLRQAGGRLKGRVQVEFMGEAGIDGGGLFKEFIDSFLKTAFNPALGLFCPTSAQLLVPSPSSSQNAEAIAFATSEREGLVSYIEEDNGKLRRVGGFTHLNLFHFLGKMLGKALYESILVEPQFSSVFLNLLLGRTNQLDDLQHLDAPMHRSLMAMKHAAARGEDISSWGIGFEIDKVRDGVTVSEEVLVNGQPVAVTKDNLHAFIHRKANYKLNIETSEQSRAFLTGFREMIPVDWMRMFSAKELQLLISGDQRPIDIADMRKHINYSGGYHDSQPYIQSFWDVVASMSAVEQGELLHFITSCPRQPLRGFGQLNPLICVQKVSPYSYSTHGPPGAPAVLEARGPGSSAARLPSAATCMNLLKLPQYDTIEQLKEKLLYAIKSHSGFELS